MAPKNQRLGRPPASSSVETRARILDAARRSFADHGYEATTNRMLAAEIGITPGAIYHYFDSKVDIYRAVLEEAQRQVYDGFDAAEASSDDFLGKLQAVYDCAHELNSADASLARFLGSARIDRLRDPALSAALGSADSRGEGFFEGIVEHGVRSGALRSADREAIISYIRAFNVGLTDGLSADVREHRAAVNGFMLVLRGYVDDA
ncbi:MAG: TetR/AcrR family transcriptional regulator [Microthrixaceae bacterium]